MASGAHLSRELFDLVKSIGESRSKQEEDRIISNEKASLKTKISEPSLAPKKMKELLIRAIYCEMLGHSADFAHIHAINFTHQKSLLNKRIGYLASSLFLDCNSSLIVLMVATIQSDLASNNELVVSSALTALIRVVDVSIIQAVIEPVQKLLAHTNQNVRKKAVYALQRFYELEPSYVGAQAMYGKMKKALCDRDPSVMVATLPYFKREIIKDPARFKDLISSFVVILKQVVEHKLPKEFEYHRMPAPWIQMKILEILALLGKDDQQSSQNMYEVVSMVLRRADSLANNIGHAVVYQCVKTLVTIYPSQLLLDTSDLNISRFISAQSRNLRYIGIDALTLIVRINPKYTLQYQDIVVDCLEDPDDTLKSKTLDLLYRMTNKQNVDFIIDKMLTYLRSAPSESKVRQGLVTKVCNLAQAYSKNKAAYIRTMNRVFETAADLMNKQLLSKVIKLVAQWNKEATDSVKFTDYTVSMYMSILESHKVIPDSLLQLIAWVVGQFVKNKDIEKAKKCILLLCQVMKRPVVKQETLGWVLHALAKLHHSLGFVGPSSESDTSLIELEKVFKSYSNSRSLELQQRSLEYFAMKRLYNARGTGIAGLRDSIFLSNEEKPGGEATPKPKPELEKKPSTNLLLSDDFDFEIQNKELEIESSDTNTIDEDLSFLDIYVQRALDNGAKDYRRGGGAYGDERTEGSQLMAGINKMKGSQLKFTEYEAPQKRIVVPPPTQFNGYLNNTGGSETGSRPVEGLRAPPSNGLNVGKQLWTTDGYENKKELQRGSIGGPGVEKPDYGKSDMNRIKIENRPSETSQPGRSYGQKPVEVKKTKTANKLFQGITDKQEDDYDDYEVDEPKREENKQPEEPAAPAPSLLELEAEGGLGVNQTAGNLLSMEPSQQASLMEPQTVPVQPQPQQVVGGAMPGFPVTAVQSEPQGLLGMGVQMGVSAASPPSTSKPSDDPFGELTSMAGGSSLLGAPTQPTNLLETQSATPSSGFSFTGAPASSGPPSMSAASFQGYTLSTDQFGAKWMSCPNEKKISVLSMKVRDPQNFLGACVTLNFKPIQIIGREAIAAALYKGVHQCLIHASIEPSGMVTAQFRSQSDEALTVASFLVNQKLS